MFRKIQCTTTAGASWWPLASFQGRSPVNFRCSKVGSVAGFLVLANKAGKYDPRWYVVCYSTQRVWLNRAFGYRGYLAGPFSSKWARLACSLAAMSEAGCQHSQTRADAPDADVHVILSSNHGQRQRHARMSDMLEVPVVVVAAKIRLAPMLREQPEMDIRRSI